MIIVKKDGLCSTKGDRYILRVLLIVKEEAIVVAIVIVTHIAATLVIAVLLPLMIKPFNQSIIWYRVANNLCGIPIMQKLPYAEFEQIMVTLEEILKKNDDDSDYDYLVISD